MGFMNGDFMFWLVVYLPTPLKNDGVSSSVGMMKFLESHKIPWFQTTNQWMIAGSCKITRQGSRCFDRFDRVENA
jgi:hypothetical protein